MYFCSQNEDIMQYNELLEKQIIGRLRLDNPWWTEKEIAPFYAQMRPRLYLDIFYPLVAEADLRRAIILMGPRRVGKLESRLPGEISITSDMQMTPPLWQKVKRKLESRLPGEI